MTSQYLDHVPGRKHYSLQYLQGGRVFSYAHQIDTVIGFHPKTILEVGAGGGVVTAALRAAGIHVTTVDVQAELAPSVAASVVNLPFESNCFDVVLCCQVLEHLPFELFEPSVRELWRVAEKGLVISLPDASPHYEVRLRLPKMRRFVWTGTREKDPGEQWKKGQWERNGHYWEIGYQEHPLQRIVREIESITGAKLVSWRVPEKKYHRFFVTSNTSIRVR